MDREGEVAQKFNIHAIPQTIVIGKDGSIRKVFVGAGGDTAEQIREEVEFASGENEARGD
jgi:thioredoxin-like negative regulator of GroEL